MTTPNLGSVSSPLRYDLFFRRGTGSRGSFHPWLLWLIILTALILRRPDVIFHAQFWAEDGAVWFADAYNKGAWLAMLSPQNGYFQTIPRLGASVALLVPLRWAPLVLNVIAVAIEMVPPAFLLTRRFDYVGSQPRRLLMAFLMLALPTSFEVHANITNSQWWAAMLMFLIIVAEPCRNSACRVFDFLVLLMGGLTGPFCILLLPIAAIMLAIRIRHATSDRFSSGNLNRTAWMVLPLAMLCATATVQARALLHTFSTSRSTAPLGATPMLLVRIVTGQVILGPIFAPAFLFICKHATLANFVCTISFAGWLLLCGWVLLRAPLHLRLLTLFGLVVLAAALISPQTPADRPRWPVLLHLGAAGRYWFIPVVSLFWSYEWLTRQRAQAVRLVGYIAVVSALGMGVARWHRGPLPNLQFPVYARQFEQLPAGSHFAIPVNPPGWGSSVLVKH
jgi:hypothetical protein